jgi:hypothetical protein
MNEKKNPKNQMLSTKEKNADDKRWYKDFADDLDSQHNSLLYSENNRNSRISELKRMKVNYDLFNDILDISELAYVCQPFGASVGELPASMVNRDISSGKIKAILGMESKRPFDWKVVAVNREATTRKEGIYFSKIRESVVNDIMQPIRVRVEQESEEQNRGKELTQEEKIKIQKEIEERIKSETPEEAKKYMEREHQDPAEVLYHQLLEYLIEKCQLKRKFNKGFKHLNLSASEIYYVGILNKEPEAWVVNPMRFSCDPNSENDFIEEGEWAVCEYKMSPSIIIKYLGDELSEDEIKTIYESWHGDTAINYKDFFSIDEGYNNYDNNNNISVLHCVKKSLREVAFLTYLDENDEEQVVQVNEEYELNADAGDISLEYEWLPEVYEVWKIKTYEPIYVKARPIPGQLRDMDNLYHCPLPYYGAKIDALNSKATALMDRLRNYQYFYNIISFRVELLIASDKGKKVLMNINTIPDSAGINIKQWQYFMESSPYMWYDPSEEGNSGGYTDASTVAKVIDLSLISDIQKYIDILEHIRISAGKSVGITDAVEGQIGPNEAASNARQNLTQTSHILEPYFELHNHVKKNVMQALIEMAKITYAEHKPKKLTYLLDDMSLRTLELDIDLLSETSIGLFVSNSTKAEDTRQLMIQLAHAALQTQKIELSDVISTINQSSATEAEEVLKVAEQNRKEFEMSMSQQNQKAAAEEAERERQRDREKHEENLEKIKLKGEIDLNKEIVKSSLIGASFNPDQDADNDGVNDFLEIARDGLNAEVKRENVKLQKDKFEHQKVVDDKKLKQVDKKLKIDAKKAEQKNNS